MFCYIAANDLDDNTDVTVINAESKQVYSVPEDVFQVDNMVDELLQPLDPFPLDVSDSIGIADAMPVDVPFINEQLRVPEGLFVRHLLYISYIIPIRNV